MSLGKVLKITLFIIVLLVLVLWVLGQLALSGLEKDQPQMFSDPVFDTVAPSISSMFVYPDQPAILVFSKTNGYRHRDAISAARSMFEKMAKKNRWNQFYTENAAVFSPQLLAQFDVVIWSNATGPALNAAQQAAFKSYLLNGGGFVGLHSAGDASHEAWPWYQSQVIRANFTGHPMLPQFQVGTVTTEDTSHPAMRHFPEQWQHEEEWYCFDASPRPSVNVLASLDESDINMLALASRDKVEVGDLAMGDDHPVIWSHDLQQGRVFYSALGHRGEFYQDKNMQTMLKAAIEWAGRLSVD